MPPNASTFIITREDLNVDPLTLVTDGLKIGRLPDCELVLNHPAVSRLHVGINEEYGLFYIFNFSHSSGTTLNGRVLPVEEAEVLADGDEIQIGPFFLHIERARRALHIRVRLHVAVKVGEAEQAAAPSSEQEDDPYADSYATPTVPYRGDALNVFWEKRKREAGKMHRLSPLRPQGPSRVLGKARFNWTPTRDLVRPWPFSVFIWALLIVGVLSLVAVAGYTQAFSPAPLSEPHARRSLPAQPAIAREANANSCATCHTMKARMEDRCASCHRAEAFVATVTEPHESAGIGCIACHDEHRGAEFRPALAALESCTGCHRDDNRKLYNGRSVRTPHGGTFGYPVVNGRWVWTGLSGDEWAQKPQEVREALRRMEESLKRWPTEGEEAQRRRSAEFHVLHLHRVKAIDGLEGSREGELSCSSCHRSFAPVDRATPRTTCAACHNGEPQGERTGVVAADQPNCTSCHVQHVRGRRNWGATLFSKTSVK